MSKNELINEIEKYLKQIKNDDFKILWNKTFKEEEIDSVDDSREDLESLFLEEVEYFDITKVLKIHKYLSQKL